MSLVISLNCNVINAFWVAVVVGSSPTPTLLDSYSNIDQWNRLIIYSAKTMSLAILKALTAIYNNFLHLKKFIWCLVTC